MTDHNLDDELLREYLAESNEHLVNIETDLLEMERQGAAADEELVNRVFRAAHSIKGGAGFFDLVKIRELAHKIETALDLVRARRLTATSTVVSVFLLSFDRLRELLQRRHESNADDITEYADAIDRLIDGGDGVCQEPAPSPASTGRQAATRIEVTAFDLSQARKGGRFVYLIGCDLARDGKRKNKTPLAILKSLQACGTILETAVDLEEIGTLDAVTSDGIPMEILYSTVLEPDYLTEIVDTPPDRVWLIEQDGARKSLAGEPVAETPAPPNGDAEPAPASIGAARPAPPEPALALETPPPPTETTIRLNVSLLDSLMTLAGELVLSRNQLNEAIARKNERGIHTGAQRVSLVTSELQELVSLTRMQPISSLFSRCARLVRNLGRELGKEAQLRIAGGDVEIDKTILEGLSDPLTHMVRNAIDHGIESSSERLAAGKSAVGVVTLSASHQAGQVVIDVCDDGRGLSVEKVVSSAIAKSLVTADQLQGMSERDKLALIFLPGVSTAEKITDISGRGVGMDVVKTNLNKLGGKIEIDSAPGEGSRFRIKLPLTLAIIPSLLVSDGGERFAIPQVNVGELIRIPASQLADRIDHVGGARVLLLRDRLLPLIYLADLLGTPRPDASSSALHVVLVNTGTVEYGLAVEQLHDTVEIVVKPLGRHIKGLAEYAGATILGDGRVAVILDVGGLAARAGLSNAVLTAVQQEQEKQAAAGEQHSLLLFHNGPAETCAIPIEQVSRIERVHRSQVEQFGERRTMQYRGATLPLVALHDVARAGELTDAQQWVVIVFEGMGRPLGLLAAEPLDMVETTVDLDTRTLRQKGVAGSFVLDKRTVLILDIFELSDFARPETAGPSPRIAETPPDDQRPAVLLAEDSDFFRAQLRRLLESSGCRVLDAEDGQAAWELLDEHAEEVKLVATDVEMPRLDGLALTRKIRSDARFTRLPVIALTSLAGDEDVARGMAAGVNEYQIKLDKDRFQQSVCAAIGRTRNA